MATEHPRARAHSYGAGPEVLRLAAVQIAIEEGPSKLTLRRVADRAGVSHGLVRHHFGSREGLFAEAVREIVGRTMYLGGGATSLSERVDATLGELRLQYGLMLSGEHQEQIEAIYSRYREEVECWLAERGVAPTPGLITLVVATLDGLAIQRLARSEAVDIDEAMTALEGLIGR